tara:strand:- start:4274 stop:4468 length:195 start_codon:yes stop_codon:yes gene_type:complete
MKRIPGTKPSRKSIRLGKAVEEPVPEPVIEEPVVEVPKPKAKAKPKKKSIVKKSEKNGDNEKTV